MSEIDFIEAQRILSDRYPIEVLDAFETCIRTLVRDENSRAREAKAPSPDGEWEGWLSMDSAPKDGTRFLAFTDEDGVDFFRWQDRGDAGPTGWRDNFINVYREGDPRVRGWMPVPLPAPPADGERRETMSTDPKAVAARLRECADDPMWADHAEVPKVLLTKAADLIERLTAPVEGMETSAEERAEWLAAEPNYDGMKYFLEVDEQRRLLRDFDRLHAQLAAERSRAEAIRITLAAWDIGSLPNDFTLEQVADARIDDLSKFMARAERMAEALREARGWIPPYKETVEVRSRIDAALTEKPT